MSGTKVSDGTSDARYLLIATCVVWLAFYLLLTILRVFTTVDPEPLTLWLTPVAESGLVALPMMVVSRRWRRGLWVVLGVLTLFVWVNIVYYRNFATLMPFTTMFWWGNIDGMVIGAALSSLRLSDLLLLLPLVAMIVVWQMVLKRRLREVPPDRRTARVWGVALVAMWLCGEGLSTVAYTTEHSVLFETEKATLTDAAMAKFSGEYVNRTGYMRYNGLFAYVIRAVGDFTPSHTLTAGEKKRIEAYLHTRQLTATALSQTTTGGDTATRRQPNFLLIVVESFESWAIDYEVGGKPAMPHLDSLIRCGEGTLYWRNVVPQISVGTSSDGQMMAVSGLLPLRDYAAANDFGDNVYPSIFKAFKEWSNYHTFDIICDDPAMWNQTVTHRAYGFDDFKSHKDIDPKEESTWSNRDYYLSRYVADYLAGQKRPWAGMIVTLSLHSPYSGKISGGERFDKSDLDAQTIHYLKICERDDDYIKYILDKLRQLGEYDNTIIAITGDHMAFGLFDAHRPSAIVGKPECVPLIILNSGLPAKISENYVGQIDIYPTLLDVCGLQNYYWHGLGTNLLRHDVSGAVDHAGNIIGTLDAAQYRRAMEAWEISRLIITSNYFATPARHNGTR